MVRSKIFFVGAVDSETEGLSGFSLGVGPLESAVAAELLLRRYRRAVPVLVGTAGAYPGGPAVGSVVCARRVCLAYGVEALGLGYVPLAPPPLASDPALRAALGLPEVDVVTVGAITTSPALAAALGQLGQVEHMEAYAVARAAERNGRAFAVVLGIANEVGPDAHAQWLANRAVVEASARAAAARLRRG